MVTASRGANTSTGGTYASTCCMVLFVTSAAALGGAVVVRGVTNLVLSVGDAVVAVNLVLFLNGQASIGINPRCVLDAVLRECQDELVGVGAVEAVTAKRNQGGVHAEQAVVNLNEGRLTRSIINEDFLNVAELLALGIKSSSVK